MAGQPQQQQQKKKRQGGVSLFSAIVVPLIVALLFKTHIFSDPVSFILPNFLLFTNQREYVKTLWAKAVKIDTKVHFDQPHVPVIEAKDYNMESLRIASENWRYPVVVRGLFNDTPAAKKWATADYLPSKIGEFRIPVVRTAIYGTLQNDRAVMPFSEAYADIFGNADSKMYLFFPVKSRFNFNGSEMGSLNTLQEKINEIVLEDLEIDKRIWNGFGTKKHSTYFGSQLIIGQGSADSDQTTGTGWHCAAGNNWFVQVMGRKRWYFLDPKYSAYMYPLRGGKVNMQTGHRDMGNLQKHLPVRYADLYPGDLLYNPDWEWHTIKNYEGLSMGVPIREVNISLSFQNNFQYTSIILLNKLVEKFGLDIGGYPPN